MRLILVLCLTIECAWSLELSEVNTSLVPEKCATFKTQIIHKTEALKILSRYLHLFRGTPQDAATIRAFTASALDQNFSYEVLYQIALENDAFISLNEAQELYEAHKKKANQSQLLSQLKDLNLSDSEITKTIQQKLTILRYRETQLKQLSIPEAELRLFYSKNPTQFEQEKSVETQAFQVSSQFDPSTISSLRILLRQGLSLEEVLKQKAINNSKFPEPLIITPATHLASPFAKLLASSLGDLQLIDTGKASLLCLVTKVKPSKKLDFYTIEKALENKLKNDRLNKKIELQIALKLKQAEYKNFLK